MSKDFRFKKPKVMSIGGEISGSIIVYNKFPSTDYEVVKYYNAGIVLTSSEAKDIYGKKCSIKGAYCYIDKGTPMIMNSYVKSTEYSNRLLLLNRKEINKLVPLIRDGYVLIPTKLYLTGNLIKLQFFVGRRLQKFQKREAIKAKEHRKDARKIGSIKIGIK